MMKKNLAAVFAVAVLIFSCHMKAFAAPNFVFGLDQTMRYDVYLNSLLILQNVQATSSGALFFNAGSGSIRIVPTGTAPDGGNFIDNCGFEDAQFRPPWDWQYTSGGTFTQTTDHFEGSYAAKVYVPVAGEYWSTQIRQDSGTLVNTLHYRVRVVIKCSNARNVTIGVVDPITNASMGYWRTENLVANQWLVVNRVFEASATGPARLAIYFGSGTGTYTVDDTGLWLIPEDYCGDPENKLINGAFDCDAEPIFWTPEDHHGNATFTTDAAAHDGERSGKIIVPTGGQYYQTQWKQSVGVSENSSYVFKAWVKADRNATVIVGLTEPVSGNSIGLWKTTNVGTSWRYIEEEFVADMTLSDARFSFYCGTTAATYWLDSASLVGGSLHPASIEEMSDHPQLLTVAPNPVMSDAQCTITLQERCNVSLTVYDIGGRVVERVLEANLPAGSHPIPWVPNRLSTGSYFVRIVTPSASEVRKVLVVR